MKQQAIELLSTYSHEVVFVHVLSALIWVGGMIAIRFAVHPVLQTIEEPKIKLGKTLQITGKLFMLVMPFIALLLITGLIMAIATDGHQSEQSFLFMAKEAIWTIMTVNFLCMFFKRKEAWGLFLRGELVSAKAKVSAIPNLLLPINIILGVVALWLGVTLRGF